MSAFGFDARDFLQPVYLSEVYATLQGVAGVVALTVDFFVFSDGALPQDGRLTADPPAIVGGALVGAQLVTIESGLLPQVVHA